MNLLSSENRAALHSICSCIGTAGPTGGVASGDQESVQGQQEVFELSIQTAPCHPFGSLNVSGDHWRHACCGLEWIAQVKAVDKSITFDLLSLAFYVIDVRR